MRIINIMVESFWPLMKAGLTVTIPLTIVSFICGLLLAIIVAVMRISRFRVLRGIAIFYVWLIRGTPLLVQLYIIYYGLPNIGIVFSPFLSGVIGLTMSQGAYNSEIIRAAIESISRGQWEACRALGMSRFCTMYYIVFPQAFRVALPSLGNQFITLTKDTSLTSALTLIELLQTGRKIIVNTLEPLWVYCEVAFVYLIYCSVLMVIQRKLEQKFGKHILAQQKTSKEG